MPTCMAYNCANTSGKTDDKSVIFTRIPATPDHVRVEWLTRLHREDIDPKKFLPGKDHVLCSRHFDERCFEIDMALKLMKGVEKRKFKDTTTIVPTIFSHVRPTAPRPNTEQRMAKKAKDKVIYSQGTETEKLSSERRNLWLARINREGFDPDPTKRHYKVCSDHFITGKKADLYDNTNPDWAPSQKMGPQLPDSCPSTDPRSSKKRYQRAKGRQEKVKRFKAAEALLDLQNDTHPTGLNLSSNSANDSLSDEVEIEHDNDFDNEAVEIQLTDGQLLDMMRKEVQRLTTENMDAVKKKAITAICRTLREEIEEQDALSLKDDKTKDSSSTNSAHSEQYGGGKSDASFSAMDKDEKPCIIPPDMIKIEKPVENRGLVRGRKVCIDDCHDSPDVNVPTISEDLSKANKEITALKLKIDVMKKLVSYQKKWSVKWIRDNDEKTCMYTGLPSWLAFLNLYTIVEPVVTEAKCELPDSDGTDTGGDLTLCDELFAVLVKLKLGLYSEDVARCFSIPVKRFKKIFEIWISSLFLKFADWSSMRAGCKKQTDYVIPSFIRKNSDVKIILCWLPLEFGASSASADDQNNKETFKMLTGLDRHGKIIFLSGIWIQQSDRLTMAENSAVLNLIKDGDTIVVPSDLEIVSALTISSKNVKVVVYPTIQKRWLGPLLIRWNPFTTSYSGL
ncbi:hypothetical protein ScPMuIL_010321 [Solemya velum]